MAISLVYIVESAIIGIFCVVVYLWVMYAIPVKQYVENVGLANRWITLIAILFVFGFEKHVFENYALMGTGYCKLRENCTLPSLNNLISLDKAINTAKNIWESALYEGLVFVCIGVPITFFIKHGAYVAFLVGFFSHIFAEWFGINADVCNEVCKLGGK